MKPFDLSQNNPKFFKKLEQMKEQNFKSQAREATDNWRKHVPVYGWVQVNYPSGIQLPLKEKYFAEKMKKLKEKEEAEAKEKTESLSPKNQIENTQQPQTLPEINRAKKGKNKHRVNPELVNQDVMKEIETLVPINYSENFLKNYQKNDFGFLKKQFKQYELNKKNFDIDQKSPYNYSSLVAEGDNKFLYQLGIKNASTFLTTTEYEKKCEAIDKNLMLDEKYCTMSPKSAMLGPKPDKNFENTTKKIGDISFEEVKGEIESVKNLSRLPPENITEEWVKENLNERVKKINFENCYWLSKDLISKLGRLDPKLKSVSLRNLDLSNYIVENILVYAKEVEELDISNCTGLTNGLLEIISEKGENIKKLNLFNLPDAVNDNGLIFIGMRLLKLKELNLGKNKNVTDKGIKGLLYKGISLEKIDLTFNHQITDEGIQLLLKYSYKTLKEIVLNFLPLVKGDGLSDLSKCSLLTHVEINGYNMTNSTADFLSGLQNLIYVDLSGCNKITDDQATGLLMSNRNMRVLRLSNCTLLTNAFLDYIEESNNMLLLLEINRTPLITDAKIQATMEKKKPNLRIIRAANVVWSKKNYGLTVPYPSDNYVKPTIKGAKKPPAKKNDDKSPENQLMKLREEMKPKMIYEYFIQEPPKKKGTKKKK